MSTVTYGEAALLALACMLLATFATVLVMSLMAAAKASDDFSDAMTREPSDFAARLKAEKEASFNEGFDARRMVDEAQS